MKNMLVRVLNVVANAAKDGYVWFVGAVERHPHVAAVTILVLLVAEVVGLFVR
jgi:hypothetical protein